MGLFNIKSRTITDDTSKESFQYKYYKDKELRRFAPRVLDIGRIDKESVKVETIAAAFDLSGFTRFCNQRDPHLYVPTFLNEFLDWLFEFIRKELSVKKYNDGRLLWTDLPFFAKFMGDGVLYLWDATGLDDIYLCNVLVLLRNTCINYHKGFRRKVKDKFRAVPEQLRCGAARGTVYSIGDGKDYVGPCINLASRLLSYSSAMFSFSNTGFNLSTGMKTETEKHYIIKRASIRGMGEEELICMNGEDFEELSPKEKRLFKDV